MGRGTAHTKQECWWVIGLHDGGVSLHEISRKTGRSRTAARNAIKAQRCAQDDDSGKKPRAGRQPALTDREVRQIVRAAATGNFFAAELKTQLGVKASVLTIQRLLKNVDHLDYTKMDKTLPLTPAHKAARLEWAEKHILNPGTWEYTIFSDEKKFNLDGPDGYKYYWRDLRKSAQSYVCHQNGGGSVIVWGAFSAKGKSALAILRGRQNSGDYIYTVSEYLLPFAHANYGVAFIFQQDNASIHASRETTHFLQEMRVDTMAWPARSPDCNPIENVWSAMAVRVYDHGRQYRTVVQLEEAIVSAWASIEHEYLDKLVKSMHHRCLAVIKAKKALTNGSGTAAGDDGGGGVAAYHVDDDSSGVVFDSGIATGGVVFDVGIATGSVVFDGGVVVAGGDSDSGVEFGGDGDSGGTADSSGSVDNDSDRDMSDNDSESFINDYEETLVEEAEKMLRQLPQKQR